MWFHVFMILTLNIDEWSVSYLIDLPLRREPKAHFDWEAE